MTTKREVAAVISAALDAALDGDFTVPELAAEVTRRLVAAGLVQRPLSDMHRDIAVVASDKLYRIRQVATRYGHRDVLDILDESANPPRGTMQGDMGPQHPQNRTESGT